MIEAVQGEYGYYFEFTLHESNGEVHPLDGTETVILRMRHPNGTVIELSDGQVFDAPNGVVRVVVPQSTASSFSNDIYDAQLVLSTAEKLEKTIPFKIRIWRGL